MIHSRSLIYRILFLLLAMSWLPMQTALAGDNNYNIPVRVFALTVPGLTANPDRIDIPIHLASGKTAPIGRSGIWRIYGGTILQKPLSTKPLTVELWGAVGANYKVIVRILVKYFATTDNGTQGWQPMYQLIQDPAIVNTPSGWKPLLSSEESPEIFDIMNRRDHSLSGYRPSLDIKAFRGVVSINSWKLKSQR